MNEIIGKPIDRVDGKLKVTGTAKYSAEYDIPDLTYGFTVQSTITSGSIKNIDTTDAEKSLGVIKVITYKNALKLNKPPVGGGSDPAQTVRLGEKDLLPLQDNRIYYNGQHIAIVVADTFENAEYAAGLIKVDYEEEKPFIDLENNISAAYQPKEAMGKEVQTLRGDTNAAYQMADVKMSETYTTPVFHHNPMEPHATIAVWDNDELTVYDSTQSVIGNRDGIAMLLGIPKEKVHLISLFIGGGFGSKGFVWPHSSLTPMAAKIVGKPVKIVLDRRQMFTCNGRRSETIQKISLGTNSEGKLSSVTHETTAETSFVDEFVETCGLATSMLYATPNLEVTHSLVKLNKGTPCPMRAPGEAPGTYAIEVAMDELAYQLKIDPLELRLINYAEKDPDKGKAWSSKNLKECYKRGAELIGWSKRNPQVASMREGKYLVGYGMATATYPANRSAASAKVQIFQDGHVVASACTQDIGTGTYTIMTQITAEELGLPVEKIEFNLGDSKLPKSPGSGGSQSAASVGGAVRAAALTAKSKIINLAIADSNSPLYGQPEELINVDNGIFSIKNNPGKSENYWQILSRNNLQVMEAEATTNVSTRETNQPPKPKPPQPNRFAKQDEDIDRKDFAFHSFGAQFAKVLVDPDLGTVHVSELASVMDIGTVLNLKTATNQIMGAMIFALGMALMEETIYDPNNGRPVTKDLAQYLVPVNADMPTFNIEFINKPDLVISPIGSRGIGEIGITGTTAAIINAIYHATGKRIRNLPATPDKIIA